MPSLPSGTVTFFFTDIEGSTALWERDQVAMATAVERHIDHLTAASAPHAGVHFKTVGDALQIAAVPMPLLHDISIGNDLIKRCMKLEQARRTWEKLEEEYGEVRIRQYLLQSAQLRSVMRLYRDSVNRILVTLDAMLGGVEEVLRGSQGSDGVTGVL